MLAIAEPPDTAADDGEKDEADGESAEDFILPEFERPPQLSDFIAEAFNLELEIGVARGGMVKVALLFPFGAVRKLKSAPLSLIAGRIGVRRIDGEIEKLQRRVARTIVAGKNEPCLFGVPLSSEPKRTLSPFLNGIGRDSPSVR